MPEAHKIKEVLEKEPRIQFAALLKGKYHLFMYLFAENTKTLDDTLYSIRSDEVFANIRSLWQVSYITYAYGYTPIRQEFFDLLKERVWHRSKEHPKRKPEQILQREYDVLRILNRDGEEGSSVEIDNE
ncbi:transcriptional regulator, AsnC family, partial [mine drainage metagenome]